jgi:hypothetical protein
MFKFNIKIKSRRPINEVLFYERLELMLKKGEHSTLRKDNGIFVKRNRLSKNEISDKFDLYNRVQYNAFIKVDDFNKNVVCNLNMQSQFFIILITTFLPLFLIYYLHGDLSNLMYYLGFFLLTTLIWYLFSISIAKSNLTSSIESSI